MHIVVAEDADVESIANPDALSDDAKESKYSWNEFSITDMPHAALAGFSGKAGKTNGNNITVSYDAGLTLFSGFSGKWEPDNIAQLKLLGKAISFSVDLSKVGCACNLALYLISMPALGWDGNPSRGADRGGQPPYYCDANQVGGQWCPEVDIMEANDHTFAATPHKCDAPVNGHYNSCDRSGSGKNTRDEPSSYGPGETYTIDTRHPFQVETEFPEKSGILIGMTTTLRQAGRQVVLNHSSSDADYLKAL